MATSPQFAGSINVSCATFANSDGTTAKTIAVAGSSGTRVDAISVSTTDTVHRQAILIYTQSSVDYALGLVDLLPASTSFPVMSAAALNYNFLPWLDPNNVCIMLRSGDTLKLKMTEALTSGAKVDVVVMGGDF